jgi:trans-aconitate methyltransferase
MWNPEAYANHSAAQLKWAQELRSRLALRGDESVLDVGCGDGKITADIAQALAEGRVVGVDSSVEMIAYAARAFPLALYPNLCFANADARALPFSKTFDLIFSNAALHWIDDHPAFLAGASRALRQGGRLVFSCGGRGNAADVFQVIDDLATLPPWRDYFNSFHIPYFFYTPDEYGPWLRQAGFGVQRLELVPKDMTHAGAEGLASWIRTTWMPITERVPENEREKWIDDFLQAYLSRFPLDPAGLAHVAMVRLEVEARRG